MKLEPCPFCGADVTKITDVPLVDESFVISEDFSFCPNCGCEIKGEKIEQRCENCKHSDEAHLPYEDLWCKNLEIFCTSDWFCANWERRRR